MRSSALFVSVFLCGVAHAQQIPMGTFISGGTESFTAGPHASFGNIGQPMVLPRITALSSGGGVGVAADLMFDVAIDTNPPSFSGSPTASLTKSSSGATGTVSINASDTESTPRVFLFHRPIAGGGAFDSTELTLTGSNNFTGNLSSLPPSEYDNMGMEYYFKAFDSRPNTARHPASGTLLVRMTDPDAKVPAALLSYGNQQSNYRIIAIPYALSGSPAEVFTDLGPSDKSLYRLFRYESTQSYAEYPEGFNVVDRGRGYFIIQSANRNTVVLRMGPQEAPPNTRSNLFQMTLHNGWNLIGNPYTVPINWDNVKSFPGNNGSALGTPKIWGSTGYTNVTEIQPFQGAFVLVTGNQTITVPFAGQTSPGGRSSPEFTSDLSQPNWKVTLRLRQNDLENTLSGFGMHPSALPGADETDDFNPPSPFDYIALHFPHPEHPLQAFATDIVNPRQEYIWRFTTQVPQPGETEISWDNRDMGNHNLELYLYDVQQNRIVNMREEDRYVFYPQQSSHFKIYFGTNIRDRIGPDETTLTSPYPNPFGAHHPVVFSLGIPADQPSDLYPVRLIVRDLVGQVVHEQAGHLRGGVHRLVWNGQQGGSILPQGVYVYSLQVGKKTFSGKIYLLNKP